MTNNGADSINSTDIVAPLPQSIIPNQTDFDADKKIYQWPDGQCQVFENACATKSKGQHLHLEIIQLHVQFLPTGPKHKDTQDNGAENDLGKKDRLQTSETH